MSVDLKIYDLDDNEIDLSCGLDFGLSRVGVDNTIGFKIKNVGNAIAKDVTITSEALNSLEDVGEEEYNKQIQATKWKSFSFYPDGIFVKELKCGNILDGGFVEGIKLEDIDFTSTNSSSFSPVWENGITEYKDNTHIFHKGKDTHLGIMGKRMSHKSVVSCRDVEIEMNMEFKCTLDGQSKTLPFINIPCRINSKGDGKGYMFMFQYRRSDRKFKVIVYKDAKGMVDYEDRDYGKSIFDTIVWNDFDPKKKISFKIYNNEVEQPTFEVIYDGKNIKLGKIGDSAINGYSMSDTSSTSYKNSGNFYWETSLYDGDYSVTTSNMVVKTENLEQPIYIKTNVGEDSINRSHYNSSTTIAYVER